MIRVKGHQNLYRDENSGAIINCDSSAYNKYVNALHNRELQKEELNKMKQDIDEIKLLLRQLINDPK